MNCLWMRSAAVRIAVTSATAALALPLTASAASVDLAWDYTTAGATGFVLYCGGTKGVYDTRIEVGLVTKYSISGLTEGSAYYCVVSAYDAAKVESPRSAELSLTVPYAKPVVNFTASPASGVAPLSATFSNTTTGQVTTWSWSFGDGATAATKTPSHVYSAPGTYTVTLTATGPGGAASKTGVIVQATAPTTSSTSTSTSTSGTTTSSTGSTSTTTTSTSGSTTGTTSTSTGTTSTGTTSTSTGTTSGTTTTVSQTGTTSTTGTSSTPTTTTSGSTTTTSTSGTTSSSTSTSTTTTAARPGLVAAYAFEQGSGVNVLDTSGYGNNGVITNATWAPGRYGGALKFAGNGWVTISSAPSIELGQTLTLEAWIYPDKPMYDWKDVIMKQRSWSTDPKYGISYYLTAASQWGPPTGGVTTSAEQMVKGPAFLPIGKWSHLASTYDGASVRLYLNGTLIGSKAATGFVAGGSGPLRIGGNGIWGEYFHGSIDEVRVYNRALTVDEIRADMNTPIVPTTPVAQSGK